MAKKFNCDHKKRQPRTRVVCEWCAIDWREKLDQIAMIIETAGKRYRRFDILGRDIPPEMELTPSEMQAVYCIARK